VVPLLENNACQVWWAHLRPACRPSLDHLLHREEHDRRDRFSNQGDRDRYTIGTALARLVLARHLDCRAERLRFDRACCVCGAQHGKPQLVASPADLQFSIAHSGQRVAVAVAQGVPVGVDVERVFPLPHLDLEALAAEVLSPPERPTLEGLPPGDRAPAILTYWTRKEALLKATGDGLRVPMATITVSSPKKPPVLLRWSSAPGSTVSAVLRRLHPGPGYVAALAVLGLPDVRVQELDAAELLAASRG